jgi:hypothetical protein
MNFSAKKSLVFALSTIFLGIQTVVSIDNTSAQSNIQQIIDETNDLVNQGNQFADELIRQDQIRVSRLSCSQLRSEASFYARQGDLFAALGGRANNAKAEGNYAASQRRSEEFMKRCR